MSSSQGREDSIMPSVRELHLEDYEAIREFWCRNGRSVGTKAQWAKQWVENPAIAGKEDRWPKGWLIEADRQEVVGYLANIPATYWLKEKGLSAAAASSWLVEVPYRGHSVTLASRFLHQPEVDLLLNPYATEVSGRIFTALGTQPFPQRNMDQPVFTVLNYRHFGQAVFRNKGLPAARLLGALAGQLLGLADTFAGKRKNNPNEHLGTRTMASFDKRFDEFWIRLKMESQMLLLARSREYLDFYFGDFLARGQCWICVHENDSGLAAYAIFVRKDNAETGMKRCWLADLQYVAPCGKGEVSALLDYGLRECKMRGMHVVESLGFCEAKRSLIAEHLPRKRKFAAWPFHYRACAPKLVGELVNPDLWDACLMDSVDGL